MYNSPPTPTGTTSPSSSSTYTRVFAIGFPIGTAPLHGDSSDASYTQHPTAVSVGPYSLINRVSPDRCLHCVKSSYPNASPPITIARAAPRLSCFHNSWFKTCKWLGVSFTIPHISSPTTRAISSIVAVDPTTLSFPPRSSAGKMLLTVRSKLSEECTGEQPSLDG